MEMNKVSYGVTKNGNLYQYEKTNKAKKTGALLGTGAGVAVLTNRLLSDSTAPERLSWIFTDVNKDSLKRGKTLIKEFKDFYVEDLPDCIEGFSKNIKVEKIANKIKNLTNNKAVKIGVSIAAFATLIGASIGINRAIGTGTGAVIDGIKNSIAKHKAAKEADAQAQQA